MGPEWNGNEEKERGAFVSRFEDDLCNNGLQANLWALAENVQRVAPDHQGESHTLR